MTNPCVYLKPGKEKPLLNRHPWVFSGAIQSYPKDYIDGAIVAIRSSNGKHLASGYFNRNCSLAGRIISFGESPPLEQLKSNLDAAIKLRDSFIIPEITNAYRLVNAEGDSIPGLIVDRYADFLVVQIGTLGMESLKPWLIQYFEQKLKPTGIYEKSQLPSRNEEGLLPTEVLLRGSLPHEIEIRENGLRFWVSVQQGQKTGFFLDHREMRQWVREISNGKRVLNAFGYTGAFSVNALAGGAKHVDTVDISEKAIETAKRNVAMNGFGEDCTCFHTADVFSYLREQSMNYDLVILDPPAFAKRQKDVVAACRGYKDINRLAMQRMPPHSILMTSSCSYYVDDALFQKVLFQAASEAGRDVKIIGTHRLAKDHPISLFHPEGQYLKSFLLYIC